MNIWTYAVNGFAWENDEFNSKEEAVVAAKSHLEDQDYCYVAELMDEEDHQVVVNREKVKF